MSKRVKHLTVDTSAFIKNVQLQELAENVYTVQEVLDEIKSNTQYKRLAVLPYNLQIKQPDQEALKIISDFAKKTGDFATLSLTDLKVLALTYQLEKENVGVNHLRSEPIVAKTICSAEKPPEVKDQFVVAGFYDPRSKKQENEEELSDDFEEIEEEDQQEKSSEELQDESGNESEECEDNLKIDDEELIKKFGTLGFNTIPNQKADELLQPVKEEEKEKEDSENEEESEDEESDDDDEGWITPSNINNVKRNFGAEVLDDQDVEVACITTDFAMQNVLKQMGLNVTSLDGRIIKHVRTFILRCYSCFKTTSDATKIFCPKCGHKTLKRVSVSVNDKGEQVIHINARRQITTKFKNQSLPKPKGGKYACNPILFEDQLIPQQRLSKKALQKTDALDENYTAGYSPFVMRDVDSRSSKLRNTANIKQWMNNYEYDNHRRGYKKNKK
ncbi:CLUMA_CG004688, isoform A [Clunio marinus]|uniref:RNA-binding protein NOB1 n=1 Tax=Clunio marinus TaxID=568069 RepID=A0A1J1HSE8_9DIPT|nr:CLUMA_CG004688, isoform A [Clunio marinus]